MASIELEFLKSAGATDSEVFPNARVAAWLEERRAAARVCIERLPLDQLRGWRREADTGNLRHDSGGFFAIEGIRVRTNWGRVPYWEQPIINQAEVGLLGFVAKRIRGLLHLLVQAKIEPGNLHAVQLSPTLQATRSNYGRRHQGGTPRYLAYFTGEKPVRWLLDQLQSEQGARFLRKRNRNIIVELAEDEAIPPHPDFVWLTIGQLKQLMRRDNVVNMDTRTVLAGIGYGAYAADTLAGVFALAPRGERGRRMLGSALDRDTAHQDFRAILSWLARLKAEHDLYVERAPLRDIRPWAELDGEIRRPDGKYFSVIGVRAAIDNREVAQWDQPMIQPAQEGLVAFIVRPIRGVYHFLVQAKLEAGNLDVLELAPTVQCLTGNYRTGHNEYSVPYIQDVLAAPPEAILYDAMQSEEGGRFFREQNRNMIVEVGEDFPLAVADNYGWLTLHQLLRLIEFNNYLNIAARSLIAAIDFTE